MDGLDLEHAYGIVAFTHQNDVASAEVAKGTVLVAGQIRVLQVFYRSSREIEVVVSDEFDIGAASPFMRKHARCGVAGTIVIDVDFGGICSLCDDGTNPFKGKAIGLCGLFSRVKDDVLVGDEKDVAFYAVVYYLRQLVAA